MDAQTEERPQVAVHTTRVEFIRPWLYPRQLDAIYDPRRFSWIEATTKGGKTLGCAVWLIEQAFGYNGEGSKNFWWCAPVSEQASMAFTRMVNEILPAGTFNAYRSKSRERIVLLNGAVISFRSGDKPDSLYGEDVRAAVVDEASRFKEDSWIAIRSTLTYTRGRARLIGNVHGRKNWFYRGCRRAEANPRDPENGYHKLTAIDAIRAGVLSRQEIISAKNEMLPHVFRELYMAEPSDDGGNPFGIDRIRACTVPAISAGDPVVWGWDLAKKKDWTVGIALDRNGDVCKFLRFRRSWWDTEQLIIHETGGKPALVDSTGVGDPIVENLQRGNRWHFDGYHFTAASKQQLMEGLMLAIHKQNISFPEGPIPNELETFEYEYRATGVRYSAPEGLHDDCVCSLALAVQCRDTLERRIHPPAQFGGY